ncbi:Protein of uncharacterised function (DUF551) [Moraxella lacunata]|uniref:Protein of uncharacterized function (DUF551) n=1 Tax=Moraxella lacunata TaxID=477 RepID=A0A378T3Z3_MORLA|nr:DUF551 domain-containing protein [Moraxella lacunata]STZ55538.1 Protein of uncharacterised function (DUF551) [Moraxella lacunata]
MLNKETIKDFALANGFKLKEQANGEMDLNPYVYEFANAIAEHCFCAFKSGVIPHKIHPTKASLNNGWISVDDELPIPEQEINYLDDNFEPSKFYLVHLKSGLIDTVYYATICDDCEYSDIFINCTVNVKENRYCVQERGFDAYDINEVKYWQPMPPPPKE